MLSNLPRLREQLHSIRSCTFILLKALQHTNLLLLEISRLPGGEIHMLRDTADHQHVKCVTINNLLSIMYRLQELYQFPFIMNFCEQMKTDHYYIHDSVKTNRKQQYKTSKRKIFNKNPNSYLGIRAGLSSFAFCFLLTEFLSVSATF